MVMSVLINGIFKGGMDAANIKETRINKMGKVVCRILKKVWSTCHEGQLLKDFPKKEMIELNLLEFIYFRLELILAKASLFNDVMKF